ncbi:MAG TPA: tetratricopeptide repeat protein [Candidatus Didemnitutus sp.]|nr:tetratricopeptide repeat protein [Candidatus Didemnitutus sp.]
MAERSTILTGLIHQAKANSRLDPLKGLACAKEALERAERIGDDEARIDALNAAAWCYETRTEYNSASASAIEALNIAREISDRMRCGECLLVLGVVRAGMMQFTEALTYLKESIDVFTDLNDAPGLASAYNNIGMIHQQLANFPSALEAYLSALRINEALGDQRSIGVNVGNVSNIYYYLGDMDRSFEYDQRSLDLARSSNNTYGTAHALEAIATHFKARGDYEEAIRSLDQALEIFTALGEKRYAAATHIKLGSVCELQGLARKAKDQYTTAAVLAESIKRHDLHAQALLCHGALLASGKAPSSSITIIERALEIARIHNLDHIVVEALGQISQAYSRVKEYEKAYTTLKEYSELKDGMYTLDRQRAVAEMQSRFDVERAEREGEVLRLKNAHLEELMEVRSQELASMAMRLVSKNAFLQRLRKEISAHSEQHPELREAVKDVLHAITSDLRDDNEWVRFEEKFEHLHQDFLTKLSQTYPKLTPTELKVCAMLKINLSNKEIAGLLSVSLRNVESHRYSIRKKLGLASDVNLTSVLIRH